MHSKQIIYRFLTPCNIAILKGFDQSESIELKITDIAMMQIIDAAGAYLPDNIVGIDKLFLAPELSTPTPTCITDKVDTWSLGVILHLIITGGIKEDGSDDVTFDEADLAKKNVRDDLKNFVMDCLIKDPDQRPSIKQLLQGSDFIKNYRQKLLTTDIENEIVSENS